jgi:hypothetical protein
MSGEERPHRFVVIDSGAGIGRPAPAQEEGQMYDKESCVWETTFRGKAPEVGETAERERTITQADVDAFAKTSGDDNPMHFDDAFVEDSTVFESRIAHGGLIIGATRQAHREAQDERHPQRRPSRPRGRGNDLHITPQVAAEPGLIIEGG